MRKFSILLIVLICGCNLFTEEGPLAPEEPDWGSADFSNYVSIGGSITSGMQSGSVFELAQYYNYPSIFTRAAGVVNFEQPLIAEPGFLAMEIDGVLTLNQGHLRVVLDENGNPTIEPTPWDNPDDFSFLLLNAELDRSYNNLAIPLITTDEILFRTTGDSYPPNPYFDMFLRNDQPVIEQAISLEPTFMTMMLGFGEVMYPATIGSGEPLNTAEDFEASYREILDRVASSLPDCDIAMFTVPQVASSAAFSLQPWYVTDIDGLMLPDSDGNPIPLLYDGGELIDSDSVFFQAKMKTDQGVGYPLSAVSEALQHRDGISEAAALEMIEVTWPKCGVDVLVESDFLSISEYSVLVNTTDQYNQIIAELADEYGHILVDIAPLFADAIDGTTYNGWPVTAEFLGGLYSLDGINPTRYGQAMIADKLIDAVNAEFGSNLSLPLVEELP